MFANFFASKGLKRTLALCILLAGQVAAVFPQAASVAEILNQVGTVLGTIGVAHAAVAGTLVDASKK